MGLPGVGAAPVERRGTEPANDEPRADPTLPKERPTQVVEPADRVETSPKTQAGDPPATEVRPDPPAIRPEVLRRFTSAAADPVRLRSLTSEVEGARTRLATGGIEVDDRAPILGVGATLTRDRSWRDIAATAFAVQPEAVTAGQYTLLAGRNPDLAALIARGGDPAGAIARQGARVTLDHTIEGAQLRATLLEAQAIALAGSREELARGATTDPVNRQAVAQIDQLLMTSADLIAEARVQAGFARLTTQVGEVERRVAGPQPTTGRVPLAEARRELDALISDTNLAPELQRTLARQSVDLTVLEARTIQPLPPSRSVPASTRAAQAVANIHATIERGRAGIDDLVARGVIRAEDAEPLRHRLAFEGAEVRADHHLRRGDFTQAREAYIDQLQLSSGMPRERLDHALRSNERGMYLFSTPPDRAAAPALIETMRGLPEARRNEMIRSMSRIAAAASTNDEDTAARGALRLLDEYASRTQDPVLWGQNRGIAARNAAMRGDLTTAGTELREALRYAVAIPDPSTRQAFVQEVREQYGNVQLQLAAGAGTYDQRRPAADELRRVRMDAENDSGATPDHRARLLLLEAQALAESSQGARARETLERLRGMRSEVAWAGERVDGFLNRHQSDDAGLRVALRELSSETLGEAMVYQGGGMAAGAAVGAAIGVWLGGIGVVPGAAIGALVGGGLGTAALKGRNYVRANRHGAFDGNVIGGISTAGTGETALNGVSLAFDALAIAAPLKATAMLGRAGARALLTPAMADLGRLTPRLEDDVARAFAAAQGRAQSLPPGAQRAAVEGEMRELILRQWTRNAVSIGGTPVAVAGLAAIAAPVAQQLYEIEASNRSSAEKSRERQRVLSHLGQAGLMVAMFGGTNHLISRYSARPGDVMARLRDGLATDQNHVPLAVGRDSMPQRGHGPVGSRVDIDGPNGRLIIGETESNAPATVTLGDRRFAAMHETSVGGQTILGLRSLDDPASPPHVVRYDRTAGTWESLEVQPGRMSRIHDGSDPRDHVYVARDTDGVPLVVTGNGLARRLDVRVPAGATPDEVAHAHALAHRGLVDTDGDVLRYRVRLNPDDPLVRDMFWNGVPAMGRHETPQGPIWMTEQGMIDTTGRALRHMGESRETNTRFYIDGEGRTLAVGTNAGGQNLPYVRSVGAVEPAMLQGFVPAFSRYSARGYRRTDFNQERARIGGDEPVRLARTLDDIPERSRTEVDVARMPADTDAAVRETLLAARNPGTAYWLDPEGRAYTTVRENGRAIAFNTEGLPVGVLSPDAGGALRMSPLSSVGDPRPILGVGNSIGQYFHVRQGARGPEHFRIVDNGRGAAAALDVEGNAVIIRPGSNEVHPEGAVSGPTGITSYVAGGRHYEVVSSVDRVTSVVRRQLSGGQTEYQVARLEPGSPPRVVIGPPGVTARANVDGGTIIVHDGRSYRVWSQSETREQFLERLPDALRSPRADDVATRRLVDSMADLRRARTLAGDEARFAQDLANEVRAGRGPLLDELRTRTGGDPVRLIEQMARYTGDDASRLIMARSERPYAADRDTSDPHAQAIFVEDAGRLRPATIDEVRVDFERRVPNRQPRAFADLPRPSSVELGTPAADGSRTMRVRIGDIEHEVPIASRSGHDASRLPTDEQIADWVKQLPARAAGEIGRIDFSQPNNSIAGTWRYNGGVLTYYPGIRPEHGPTLTTHEVAGHGLERGDPRLHALLMQARMLDLHVYRTRHGTNHNYGDRNPAELFAVAMEEWAAGRSGGDIAYMRRVLDSAFPPDAAATPQGRERMRLLLPFIATGLPLLVERDQQR